ncbi:hypothetical protein GGS24DRAFT_397140 [Hypoxylon argillaceum]|nr:hypothetical protein GGS24DRAFT_397140 [Hypoxylon argillaceum]
MTTLPTPRDLLTSLISSLPSIPISNTTTTTANVISSHRSSNQHIGTTPSTNPFRLIPPSYRPLLTTLHVLYPSTLLPALDLLDRRLVTRVILKQDDAQRSTTLQTDPGLIINPDQEDPNTPEKQGSSSERPLCHLVSSAQPRSHRRHQPTSSSGRVYIVRLESWNCTCAAFAFAAFPPLPSPTFSSAPEPAASRYHILPAATSGEDADDVWDRSGDADRPWEFGGLSADGRDGAGGVPCCKHLLACVLAEKWSAVLGGYIEQRSVSREEGAGLVGDL